MRARVSLTFVPTLLSGDVTAVATLSPEQALKIRNMPKGDIIVPVRLSDSRGNEPAVAEMCWAWVCQVASCSSFVQPAFQKF